jgi:hypothetical protein
MAAAFVSDPPGPCHALRQTQFSGPARGRKLGLLDCLTEKGTLSETAQASTRSEQV